MVTIKTTCRLLLLVFLSFYSGIAFSQQTIENNRICLDPIAGTGAYVGTPLGGGICVLCSISNAGNVVDGNLGNYATVTLLAQAVSGYNLMIVKDSLQYYPAGNEAGFIIAPDAGLLNAAVLSNLSIETYRNGVLQETATLSGSPTLNLAVLQGTSNGKQILSFTTTADFDEVRLVGTGTVSALTTLRIYEAFEGPASCAHDCINALTGSEVSSVTTDTPGILCIATSITNSGNTNNADTTDFATINIPLGLACSRYIQVNASSTYPAGSFAGFLIKENTSILGLNLLGGVTISTYNGGVLQETVAGTSLLSAVALPGTTPTYQVGFKTTLPYNQIRITVGGVASLLTSINVYYAYVKLDSDNDGVPDCMDKCSTGDDLLDTDGDGIPDGCDSNAIDLSLSKTVNNSTPSKGGTVVFTITATRDNTTQNATGVKVTDILPTGLTYVSHSAGTGTFYTPGTGIWTIGSALGGTTNNISLTITATADSSGVVSNVAQITASNETDTDNASTQDHIASACVTVPIDICQGKTITLIAPTAGSYQWYRNDTLIVGATNDTLIVATSGDYTVNFTSTSGCLSGNCCPVIINVNALPAISAGSNITACAGTTSNLTATGTGTLLWNTGATTSTISVSPTLTTNYTVTITDALGCVNSDTVTVTANPAPLSANAVAICDNNSTTGDSSDDTFTITLNPSGGSGGNYTVSLNGSVVGTFAYGTTSVPIPAGLITSGSKTLIITDSNTCELSTVVNPPAACSSCPPKVCVPITIVKSE
ncbi:DUF11 domain-containing protein [Emticicia sp. BO119]|uniref:DUF11 domain-containing protein n=1 Tax=Emticicia sp. BO119 TaxID=2757768 RepID=UPI0015F074A6|nr:DUF11 domain-containing protein [Emticicia sp. BO119]MBA4849844.1 DUF11 domain-containing protein [Emticicia sp. BO119]